MKDARKKSSRLPPSSTSYPRRRGGVAEASAQDRILHGEWVRNDLAAEARRLRAEPPWESTGRNAKTLVMYPDLRIVLTVMKAHVRMEEHRAKGRISIHAIEGCLRVHLADASVDLPAGSLLALDRGHAHDVEALEDSAFLLSISLQNEVQGLRGPRE